MKTIVLTIEYDGSNYYGFQKQTGNEELTPTIQGKIENAIEKILGKRFETKGAGRTDRGVHALGQVVSVHLDNNFNLSIPPKGLQTLLNKNLPLDIVVKNVKIINDNFHARAMAKEKTYVYLINQNKLSAFSFKYYWFFNKTINFLKLKEILTFLKGNIFCAPFCDGPIDKNNLESYYKNINFFRFYHLKKQSIIVFMIKAQSFLYKMVRRLVGFSIDYATNRFDLKFAKKIMSDYNLRSTYIVAPPNGLYLYKVIY